MKLKLVFPLVLICLAMLFPAPARADGIIIPKPPACDNLPDPLSYGSAGHPLPPRDGQNPGPGGGYPC